MTTHSVSKVKVALGINSIILIYLLSYSVHAQPSSEDLLKKRISLACENMHFEKVLEQLTKQTNLHFIYSSSKVALDKPVTLVVDQHPLKNVLDIIARQMDITFKRQGNYFVIKKNVVPQLPSGNQVPDVRQISIAPDENDMESSTEGENYNSPNQRFRVYTVDTSIKIADNAFTKDLLHFGPGLVDWDTAVVLKYLPLLLNEKSLLNYQKKWFASAGLWINEYGVGIESQVGIPALYVVVNAGLLSNGLYRFGYGLGTSIAMKPGVSATLAYTFANMRRTEYDGWQSSHKSISQHHHLRLMANIALSRHFSVRIGPSFNFLNTYHYFQEQPSPILVVRHRSTSAQNYIKPSQSGYIQSNPYPASIVATEFRTIKSWVGFEAGVAYRINFSLRK